MNTSLDKRSLLDVACRVLGIYQLIGVCFELVTFVDVVQGLYRPQEQAPALQLTYVVARTIIGLLLLYHAPRIVRLAYGEPERENLETKSAEDNAADKSAPP